MRVEALAARPHERGVALPVRVTFADGSEHEVVSAVPREWAPADPDDLARAAGLALVVAFWFGEDVELRGHLDQQLLRSLPRFSELLAALWPGRRTPRLEVEGAIAATPADGRGIAAFISRGVDSIYLAARGETLAGPVEHLVFVDGLEPRHSDATRAAEIEGAREIARRLDLPLTPVYATPRTIADGIVDWVDAIDPGLAWVAHSITGGFRRVVLAAGQNALTLGPGGAYPLLAPLLSTSATALEPGSVVHNRVGKVGWLAEHRPDLLDQIKVCYAQDTPGNCGRCGKCVVTMAALRAVGALERAPQFGPLDLDLVGIPSAMNYVRARVDWSQIAGTAAEHDDRELARHIRARLQRAARDHPIPPAAGWTTGLQLHGTLLYTAAAGGIADLDAGRGFDPAAGPETSLGTPVPRGLLRTLDLRGRRHLYGAGTRPPGELTAELGCLVPPGPGRLPLWISPDGSVCTPGWSPPAPAGGRARWALAPLLRGRGRVALRRALDAALAREAAPAAGRPAGHLFAQGGEDRLPLYAAAHPIIGDVLLATDPQEATAAGYGPAVLLGHLLADAPETGRLGVHRRPVVPWSR